MTQEQQKILTLLKNEPYKFGHAMGFTKLTPLNNEWIKEMVYGKKYKTLQAHRGSYKTTCVSIAFVLKIILFPNKKIKFYRKNDTAVKEIVHQVSMMLKNPLTKAIVYKLYGVTLELLTDSAYEINTNLTNDPRGTSQLTASGIKSSQTGQHYDEIFTDDIVTREDRYSHAEREATKSAYYELRNIVNPSGRIFNSGTPWHKEDCFTIMPEPEQWDCYHTGLLSKEEINALKSDMLPSLFAANYELRHIASEDVIFTDAVTGAEPEKVLNANFCHIDAAYGGEDYTAFTICKKIEGKYYVYGRLWRKAVDNCLPEIIEDRRRFLAGKIYCETNADKGYLAKSLREKGERAVTYAESMNKHVKIVTHLKGDWKDVIFVRGTDEEYINQILDYNEEAEHDDAPDSLACMLRLLHPRKDDSARTSSFGI